jgi:Domain of unknown function (DUF4157)/Bacterial toxin 4
VLAPPSTKAPLARSSTGAFPSHDEKRSARPATQAKSSQSFVLPAHPASLPVDPPDDGLRLAPSEFPAPSAGAVEFTPARKTAFDPLESEAELIAQKIVSMPPPSEPAIAPAVPRLRRARVDDAIPASAPPHVRDALHSPGLPLPDGARAFMEKRFGQSFAQVRIHTGAETAESAAAIEAQAYTVGNHVVLPPGRPHLESPQGRLLLAHELVHVIRQSQGFQHGSVQASPGPPTRKARTFNFRVKVDRVMNPDELMREFIRQYYRIKDERDVNKKLRLWKWHASPMSATEKDKERGYLVMPVFDYAQYEFESMPARKQHEITQEANERFWAQTGYKPGQQLGNSPKDQEMARQWLGVRADIVLETQQIEEINALPEDIKKILFAGDHKLNPDDYEAVLQLAAKLQILTPAERADYLSKVNTDTTSLTAMSDSIDRYMMEQGAQHIETEKTEASAEKIFGMEGLYKLWTAKNEAWEREREATKGRGYIPQILKDATDATDRFNVALQKSPFKTEGDFTDAIEAYRLRFRAEAVHLAMEVMARYEHQLFLAKKKYQDPANAAALVKNIGATSAKADYEQAESKSSAATMTRMTAPDDFTGGMQAGQEAADLDEQSEKLRARAESEVIKASGNDPIIDPGKIGRGTDRQKLAGLNAADAKEYLLKTIQDRYDDLAKARAEFTEDPDRIFSQPDLVQATKHSQHIGDDTIYSWIVRDYIQEQHDAHLFTAVVLTIIGVILAALVPGGGWVAAAALITSATISTVQAIQAIQDYQTQSTDYRLGFIQKEPSLAWVAVAVVGAALDLGVAASTVFKTSAAALSELEPELKGFSEAADTETAATKLKELDAKIDEVHGLQKEVKQALKEKAAAELGLRKAVAKAGGAMYSSLGGVVDPTPVFEALYYGIKKGATTITQLRNESKILQLMGDVTKLSSASREELLVAFNRVKKIVAYGRVSGMDDATVLTFVDRLAAQRAQGAAGFEAIKEDMMAWTKPRAAATATAAGAKSPLFDTGPGIVAETRTAGKGGITRVQEKFDALGVKETTIEGELKPGMNRALAPNFNKAWKREDLAEEITESLVRYKKMSPEDAQKFAKDLMDNYEAAHLWGPGFGDEAAAGMLWAPIDVNQNMQNRFAELFGRDLQKTVTSAGGKVKITATSVPFDSETLLKNGLPANAKFLDHTDYKIVVEMPNKPPMEVRITVKAGVPGPNATGSIELNPPDLAEQFLKYLKK